MLPSLALLVNAMAAQLAPLTLYTFGDSILGEPCCPVGWTAVLHACRRPRPTLCPLLLPPAPDCARYNTHRVAPAQLLLRNDDVLFPSFKGRDLASKGIEARLVERARDGATAADLEAQLRGLEVAPEPAIALVTGGRGA